MRVEIRAGGDGVTCWNAAAIQAYAEEMTAKEERLRERNPDLLITPGRVKCYGCEVQEYQYAMKCTAELTKSLFAVEDEVKPRAADAAGQHREIPGLATTKPDDGVDAPTGPAAMVPNREATPANNYVAPGTTGTGQPTRPTGLRGLFNRGS